MAAATAREPAADKRWGFAAAVAAATARTPVVGALGTAPKPTNPPTQRGAFPWGDRPMPPAPNAWGSSSLLPLKNDGGSGSFGSIYDRPSSPGSSSTSTDGSDLLDSPLAWGPTLHNSTAAISHPQSNELRSGSWQFPRSQTSFSDVLKAPLRTVAKRRPTTHGKGFSLSADDFPVLVSKNSQSNSQQGHSFQGRPTFSSVIMAARDEQRKIPITGGDPVSTTNFSMKAQQAQLHATQTPDICMPPPCIDYWHPPPDHPPDRNGIWHGGAAPYGPCKPADSSGSFPVESFTHNGQSLLNLGGEARHGSVHGGYHPENNDSSYAHVPADACIKSLPHLMLGKVKDNHSEAQVIKKDMALLEKIKCLNIKARNLRVGNMSGISSCRESKVEHLKSIDVEAYHMSNDIPVSAVVSDITSAFDMANPVSESSNHVPIGTSDVSASANPVMIDLSEGHAIKFSEAKKPGESADSHVYGVGNASRNKHGTSVMDTASDVWGPGSEEHSPVDSLPVATKSSEARKPGESADNHVYGIGNTSRNKYGSSVTDTASDIWGTGWEEHSAVDSLPVAMTNTHEDHSFRGNSSRQVHHSRRELSAQHAKRPTEQERWKMQQKVKSIAKLEDWSRHWFVQSQKSDDAPGKNADHHVYGGNASRNRLGSFAEDIAFKISGLGWEDHPTVDSFPFMTNTHQGQSFSGSSEQVHDRTVDDMLKSPGYELSRTAQHARQLQKEERGELQHKAKAKAKLEELNRSSFVQNHKSNDVPLEADKILRKGSAGGSATANHDTSTSDTSTAYAENLNVPLRANDTDNTTVSISSTPAPDTVAVNRGPSTHNIMPSAMNTDINMLEHTAQKSAAQSHDSSAPKHLQLENRGGQVHKKESRVSTPAIDTADANEGPLIYNVMPSTKNTDINMIHIDQKGASQSHDSTAPTHSQMEDKRRQIHSQGPPASESAGVNESSLIHNVMPSAKSNDIIMMDHIARKSASQSHENSAPKHLQIENRRRQIHSQDRILRERSNIAESTENITAVAGTLVDTLKAEAKHHVDLSTQSKNRRSASSCVFGTENAEASTVHKTHISGVVINSAIIPVQVSSVRGFTVGSIMLGDASLASVNQQEKTAAKKMHDDVTNSCAGPTQAKQSGMNRHGVQHVKDPHWSDSIMHTPFKETSKKEKSEAGVLNCMAIPSPTQPSGNQSIVAQNVAPAKTNEMERYAAKPAYKELDLQNLRPMLPAENHRTSSDNSSTSKLDTKVLDKEAVVAPTATKAVVKMETENQEDEKTSKHLGKISAASNQVSMDCSDSAVPNHNEQDPNSYVLKVMQELSDQLEQVEKQLESSTHDSTMNSLQPTRMVSLPGYSWEDHQASRSQRQYHVDGQGNLWMNYGANSYMDVSGMARGAPLPATHLLSGPVSVPVPQNNAPSINSAPGWTWDTAEQVLISNMGDAERIQNVYRVGQIDLLGVQAVGGMAYGPAAAANPEVLYCTGPGLQQLNPGYQLGPMVGAGHPGYQLVPVAPPVAGWPSGSAMVSAGHPSEAWGAAYREHLYFV